MTRYAILAVVVLALPGFARAADEPPSYQRHVSALFSKLGWMDTLYPLWVPFWFGGSAFAIFLIRQFLMTLPRELDEAAVIDGKKARPSTA